MKLFLIQPVLARICGTILHHEGLGATMILAASLTMIRAYRVTWSLVWCMMWYLQIWTHLTDTFEHTRFSTDWTV